MTLSERIASQTATEMAAARKVYPYKAFDDPSIDCPYDQIGEGRLGCPTCNYTDKIGICYYPVKIEDEIAAGRARPTIVDVLWPELEEDLKLRACSLAFRDVDRR
jgi:hypothetical protein